MAQKRTVTEFLTKMREAYTIAREEYTRLADKVIDIENRWKAELNRGWGDVKQKNIDTEIYNRAKKEAKDNLKAHIEKAYARIDEIMAECDSIFGVYDRATGDKVDLATLELLKSGILRKDEIIALANDFNGNCAMLRLIGEYAFNTGEKIGDSELRTTGSALKNYRFPYKEHIETLADWSKRGLREDIGLSNAIDKVYAENTDKIFASAEGICVEVAE